MAAHTPDPTIPRLPPYRAPPAFTERPPSPSQQNGLPNDTAPAAYGCELIIRDVTPISGLSAAQTVEAAIKAAALNKPDASTKYTYTLPSRADPLWHLTFLPTRAPTDTYCYARVSKHVSALDTQPRPDLLEDWFEPLRALNPQWKPAWSPARDGRDKSMWLKVSGLSGNGKDAGKAELALVAKQLDAMRIKVASYWSMDSGRDGTLILCYTADVSRLLQQSFLDVVLPTPADSRPSPSRLVFTQPFVQVQPEGPFEMAVRGISQYDYTVKHTLDRFFKKFHDNNGSTRFSDSRIDGDAYIFRMRDWEGSQYVLKSTQFFDEHVKPSVPNAIYPRLVYDINSENSWVQRTPASAIRDAGGHMQTALDDIHAAVNSLRKDQTAGFAALDRRVGSVEQAFEGLTKNMVTLTDMTVKAQHSIFGLHLRGQLADDRTRLLRQLDRVISERLCTTDAAVLDDLNAELKSLHTEIRAVNDKLDLADKAITDSMAPPSISSPQPRRPPPTPALSATSPPVTPTPKRKRHQPTAADGFSATTREEMVTEDEEEATVVHSVLPEDTEMTNAS
ncbi:hypothetical protein CPB85DRAFT_1328535 [Mucidula mucida]|nr:hypothetical protein CPB85DRAFT_1328535 [Mucidula mucida]